MAKINMIYLKKHYMPSIGVDIENVGVVQVYISLGLASIVMSLIFTQKIMKIIPL